MSYLKFDKEQLINLEYSLDREILRSNLAGAYISTTISGCNTRKYHGLLICPISKFGDEKHVLLSSLDETIVDKGSEFNLGIHRYQGGAHEPKGHKYIRNIEFNRITKITYWVGSAVFTKEQLLVENEHKVLLRYTLVESSESVKLRFKPFLAFRQVHQLSKANMYVNRKFGKAANGISVKLYDKYPNLFMQFSKKAEFVPVPDWYYNIEYIKELHRGYEYLEDLFVPGYFEISFKKGESIIFSAGTVEANPESLKKLFTSEENSRTPRITFLNSLDNAAGQFVIHRKDETDIIAGFPWYDSITRQTFVSLTGLCLSLNNIKTFKDVLHTYMKYLKNGFFPDHIHQKNHTFNSADAPLWFIWAIIKYFKKHGHPVEIWKEYGGAIQEILNAYRNSTWKYVGTTPEGLVYAQKENTPLTWMNASVDGRPVVQRDGLPVEINALWYNAICFAVELAGLAGEHSFVEQWKPMIKKVGDAFVNSFWNKGHDHLADVVKDRKPDWSVRPNMVIAVAMDYSPLTIEQQKSVLSIAKRKLLTKRGLRTLSPDNLRYKGSVEGNPSGREIAIHQGAAWPWLIQFFVEAYLKIHKKGGLPFVKQIMEDFEDDLTEHCIGSISEMYNGNPPHSANGAISQAWSVAGVVYATHLVQNYKE
ncbi:MAG: glycogen debranching [Prolixibacteraceae bacterium]|nr:MAG: glycogen debranching [Prolixibacteraceae bacterium]